jgi:hypothetical protein
LPLSLRSLERFRSTDGFACDALAVMMIGFEAWMIAK